MEGLKPAKEGIENLLQAITFPAYPSIQAADKETVVPPYPIGDIAQNYLSLLSLKLIKRSEYMIKVVISILVTSR